MKIAFYEVEDRERAAIESRFPDHQLMLSDKRVEDCSDENAFQSEAISTFIYSHATAENLARFPNLKLIATRSTGFDHIDLECCRQRNISVVNVPFYGENTVAEHTFALILALSRKIVTSAERARLADFSTANLTGFDLKGKTIGVVGTGHIGAHVVRIAHGFEMNILLCDKFTNPELENKYGARYVELDELLAGSDIISLHLPAIKETFHLINKGNVGKIKKGAYIINTARGALIETEALFIGLKEGIIGGVGLDVFEEEADIKEEGELFSANYDRNRLMVNVANNVILHDPRVVATPHNAFNSKEALLRILSTSLDNISAFMNGQVVNSVLK